MKVRENRWDNLKGFLILLVVVGHFGESFIDYSSVFKKLWNIIYTFHMPLFIFISGLFSNSTVADKEKLKKKVFFFVRLYLYYKIAILFERIILTRECGFRFFEEKSVPWYMLAMAIFMCITYCVKNLKTGYVLTMAIMLSCIVGYDGKINDIFALARVVNFYPFFLMGYYANTEMKVFKQTKKKIALSIFILVVFSGVVVLFNEYTYLARAILTGRNTYYNYAYPEIGWLYKLLYLLVAVIIGGCIVNISSNRKSILTFWGQRSLQIYFIHGILIRAFRYLGGVEYLVKNLPNSWEIVVIIMIIIVMMISSLNIFKVLFDNIASGRYVYKDSK